MQKGIKFRAYPNKEQQNLINQTLGCCRLIYNKGLAMRNAAYENGSKVGYSQTSAMLTELKKTSDFAFLKGGCGRNPGPNEVINRRRSRTCIPTKND